MEKFTIFFDENSKKTPFEKNHKKIIKKIEKMEKI